IRTLEEQRTIYIKPRYGSGGRGITLLRYEGNHVVIQSESTIKSLAIEDLSETLSQDFPADNFVLQPGARVRKYKGACYDIRAMIQNDGTDRYEVTAISVRVGRKGHWVSNLNSGGDGLAIEALDDHFRQEFGQSASAVVHEVKEISERCVGPIKDTYGDFAEIALDMLYTVDHGPVILEGNSKPSRWVFNRIAEQHPEGSPLYDRYKFLRKKTVSLPVLYAQHKLK
ncbi:MAG: YheC/YheD family protein, partial [Bacteroidota bacterium]